MSEFKKWKPRVKDLPGQADIFGACVAKPDEACKKNVGEMKPPERGPLPPVKEVRMVVDGDVTYWVDSDGNVVSNTNKHPYTGKKS